MNKKEAESIAWELYKLHETFSVGGPDATMIIANQANDILERIIETYPKIAVAFEKWKSTTTESITPADTE